MLFLLQRWDNWSNLKQRWESNLAVYGSVRQASNSANRSTDDSVTDVVRLLIVDDFWAYYHSTLCQLLNGGCRLVQG